MGRAGLATAFRRGVLRVRPEDHEACAEALSRFRAAADAWEADSNDENARALRAADRGHYEACQTALGNAHRDAQARRAAAAAARQGPPSGERE